MGWKWFSTNGIFVGNKGQVKTNNVDWTGDDLHNKEVKGHPFLSSIQKV